MHDQLGLPLEKVNVITGDTDLIPMGGGTVGSRSMPTGGAAVQKATIKLADNLKALAAQHLDAKPEEIEIADGLARVRGTNRALSFAELASKPGVSAEQLSGIEKNFIPKQPTYPNGTHVCEVEIDPETGHIEFKNYVVVDDFGVSLNPLLLEGQVHGGIGQGIGQAIMENTVYDADGQLLSASLMDYALPRAGDVPNYSFETKNVPCTTNPLGVKGAGEAGAIGSCPAVMNAVVDALHRGLRYQAHRHAGDAAQGLADDSKRETLSAAAWRYARAGLYLACLPVHRCDEFSRHTPARMNLYLGIALQLGATFLFTLMGALIRYLGDRVPIGEAVFARSFLALIPLFIIFAWRGELSSAFRMNRPLLHFTRAITGIGAMVLLFLGLHAPAARRFNRNHFITPLFNVALAAIFLGEVVRLWRWSAVVVGFIGVVVMLSPHIGVTQWTSTAAVGAIMTLFGAFFTAVAMTQVRSLIKSETTASLVFSFQLLASVGGLLTLPWGWLWPSPGDALALLGVGVFGGIAQILLTDSYRHAPAAVVAPFSYTAMIWAVVLGYFLFDELPGPVVLLGAAIVIAAGLFVIFRERALGINRQKEKEAQTPPAGPPVD